MKTAAEIAAESRARQGLPRHVDDVAALDRLATLLAPTPATSAPDRVPAGAVRGADIGVAGSTAPVPQKTSGRDALNSAAPAGSTPTTPTGPADAPARARRKKAAGGQRRQETA